MPTSSHFALLTNGLPNGLLFAASRSFENIVTNGVIKRRRETTPGTLTSKNSVRRHSNVTSLRSASVFRDGGRRKRGIPLFGVQARHEVASAAAGALRHGTHARSGRAAAPPRLLQQSEAHHHGRTRSGRLAGHAAAAARSHVEFDVGGRHRSGVVGSAGNR